MRIRKKLIVLHTLFSIGLAGILLLLLRPAVTQLVREAEASEARTLLGAMLHTARAQGEIPDARTLRAWTTDDVGVRAGTAEQLDIAPDLAAIARSQPATPLIEPDGRAAKAIAYLPRSAATESTADGVYYMLAVRNDGVRSAVVTLYALLIIALLAVYGLVALSLEVFVLPQHVYAPIRRMLQADKAVQEGRRTDEIIPESAIPADELGELMRSRNESIVELRRHERDLARALSQLEEVATDLARKNHLLETARRNLADADRLAGLGMMSAGIAHELNTPLAVLKGLVEKLNQDPGAGVDGATAALMLRVVARLERLGEGLLDYARVRSPKTSTVPIRAVVDEAATLVRLDRGLEAVTFDNAIAESLLVECDADRMMQVFVNLLRNAADALRPRPGRTANGGESPPPRVEIRAEVAHRDSADWVSITVSDNGPGIDPDILPRLFQPFASTRLDARGTGLGLAVAEGIVREHGGLLLARNRTDGPGAVFEVMLPRPQD